VSVCALSNDRKSSAKLQCETRRLELAEEDQVKEERGNVGAFPKARRKKIQVQSVATKNRRVHEEDDSDVEKGEGGNLNDGVIERE